MPLCERPAGQNMENPTSPSHKELVFGSPLADLGKYSTAMSFKKAYWDIIL